MITDFTQRWSASRKPVYQCRREYFNRREFEIAELPEKQAKEFVLKFHYSNSYPSARRRFGLFQKGELVGVAVYSHPMSEKTITNVFRCKYGRDGLELGRLVLLDEVLSNGESFFVAECHRRLKRDGFVGVVSFSDDLPRTSLSGEITHAGHLGFVYQSLNAAFLNRGISGKIHLLPDGNILSARTISKIRNSECGCDYGAQILVSHGADAFPSNPSARRDWLVYWLKMLTRPTFHHGNLRYAWSFCKNIQLKSLPYPKIRLSDVQPKLNFLH